LPKLDEKITVNKWLAAWDRVYERDGNVKIEIVGGEPLIYPGIDELLQGLTKKHHVSIVTNLSRSLEKLINLTNGINSEKLNMTLSFHPSFAKLESFLNKAIFLKEKGISNVVFYVTYPPQFKLMAYFKREFEQKGLQFIPVPFRGKHNGIDYPGAYTEKEKSIISSLSGGLHKEQKRWVENQLAPQKTRGRLCRAGQIYSKRSELIRAKV